MTKNIAPVIMPQLIKLPTVQVQTMSDVNNGSYAADVPVSIAPINDAIQSVVSQIAVSTTDVNDNFSLLQHEVNKLAQLCELQDFVILGLISAPQYVKLKKMLKSTDDDTQQLAYKMINEFRNKTTD